MLSRVRVKIVDFKSEVQSMVVESDGWWTIFLNDRMCYECKKRAYLHELNHILHDDFTESIVTELERRAHEG